MSIARGSQKEGPDGYPYCSKCYGANYGPKGFRGGAVDGSMSISEHKFDTASHKSPRGGVSQPAPVGGVTKNFCDKVGRHVLKGVT